MKKLAFLFPGQGAQYPGMGKDFYRDFQTYRETLEEAEDLLRRPLTKVMLEGPQELLQRTDECQLAMFLMSIGILRILQEQLPALRPSFCAGLSAGEFTALTAAGIITFNEALYLLEARGRFMQRACQEQQGAMCAVMGLTYEELSDRIQAILSETDELLSIASESEPKITSAKELGAEVAIVGISNYNAKTQSVISGNAVAMRYVQRALGSIKGVRLRPLSVAGAFHSELMASAAEEFMSFIDTAKLMPSKVQVVSNVSAREVTSLSDYRDLLKKHITQGVLWDPSIRRMDELGVGLYVEIGCGRVLTGLNRRIGTLSSCLTLETVEELEGVTGQLALYAKV